MKMLMGCKPELQRQYINTVARYLKGYRTLEPNAVKVARSVLKGLGVGNDLRLLNIATYPRLSAVPFIQTPQQSIESFSEATIVFSSGNTNLHFSEVWRKTIIKKPKKDESGALSLPPGALKMLGRVS